MKALKIECCGTCPQISAMSYMNLNPQSQATKELMCRSARRMVDDIVKIPEWCPLPEWKDLSEQ